MIFFRAGGLALCLLLPSWNLAAAETKARLLSMDVELNNRKSLQRGARLFRNYCLSCHAASYMRYNRMGRDLGFTERVLLENFIFDPTHRVGDTMTIALDSVGSKRYFGVAAPDLSVIARSRGADWLYSYLKSFYVDPERPFGVNNLVLPNVNMPHVLWDLQGMQKAMYEARDESGKGIARIVGFETVVPGLESEAQYDRSVRDLVNFMVYLGEPANLNRVKVGVWVLLYLFVLLVVVWFLKQEYWKDVT